MGMDTPAFDKWFEQELKENKEFSARWHEYEAFYESNSEFFGRRYQYQGSGDYNLFKLFIEAGPCPGPRGRTALASRSIQPPDG